MSMVHQNWWFTTLLISTSHFSDLLNGGQYLNCLALPLETSWESRDEDYESITTISQIGGISLCRPHWAD